MERTVQRNKTPQASFPNYRTEFCITLFFFLSFLWGRGISSGSEEGKELVSVLESSQLQNEPVSM